MSMTVRCPACDEVMEVRDSVALEDAVPCSACGSLVALSSAADTVAYSRQAAGLDSDSERSPVVSTGLGDLAGRSFGDCLLEGLIGRGGMGAVYRAFHRTLNSFVAVKVLSPHIAADNADYVERFHRAAQTARRLDHPNIVGILDHGTEGGCHYTVMEYIEGETLQARLNREGRLPLNDAIGIALRLCDALGFAVEHQVVHRDVKPANVLLGDDGGVRLADMGLAKDLVGEGSMTQSGMVIGSLHYMSPEQARNARTADHRSDIYSLGCTLYQMVTGHVPYEGPAMYNILSMHMHAPVPDPRDLNPDVPDALAALIMKAMAKRADERIGSARALAHDLRQVLAGHGIGHLTTVSRKELPIHFVRESGTGLFGFLRRCLNQLIRGLAWGGRLLRSALRLAATASWYVMFFWLGRGYFADASTGTAGPESFNAQWQALFVLGGLLFCVGNLIPLSEERQVLPLLRRIPGYSLLYVGALLFGTGFWVLGAAVTFGAVLLLWPSRSLQDELNQLSASGGGVPAGRR